MRGGLVEPVRDLKQMQVKGKKYLLPVEDINVEKLIQMKARLMERFDEIKRESEAVDSQLIEIARARRQGTTTVTLHGISDEAVITFRESFTVSADVEEIAVPLGPLFARFFKKDVAFKTTADFKKFMESNHALGLANAEEAKKAIMGYVAIKETKPNVKIQQRKE